MLIKKARFNPSVLLWVIVCLFSFMTVIMMVPALLVKKIPDAAESSYIVQPNSSGESAVPSVMIPVYLSRQEKVETVPLEKYVRGVIAAEMPAEFELEALKAQAMASRTYIVRRIIEQDFSNVPVKNAWVTDTIAHQAYADEEELKARWGSESYPVNMDKINRAVEETKDLILTYENKPIYATFFSTSNGYTENSEDYWPESIPYLRSVASPWDVQQSPKYKVTTALSSKEVAQKLGISTISPTSGRSKEMRVLEWTTGHRIKKMSVGGKTLTGREVREKLELASSQFDWKWDGTKIEFTTYGYGHGVGLSQYGANGMAKEGKKAEEIVAYYYKGIAISKASGILPGL